MIVLCMWFKVCICVLLLAAGASEASFLEIPALTCTCVVATFFWFLLTLFIRKLRQVNRNVEGEKFQPFIGSSITWQRWRVIFNFLYFFFYLKPDNSHAKPKYLSIIMDTGNGPIEEQCERLQYDPNQWEFPRERLKLGAFLDFVFSHWKKDSRLTIVLCRFWPQVDSAELGGVSKVFKMVTDPRIFSQVLSDYYWEWLIPFIRQCICVVCGEAYQLRQWGVESVLAGTNEHSSSGRHLGSDGSLPLSPSHIHTACPLVTQLNCVCFAVALCHFNPTLCLCVPGKPLGHGAFGKVIQATAFGIDNSPSCSTVAVKMLKGTGFFF